MGFSPSFVAPLTVNGGCSLLIVRSSLFIAAQRTPQEQQRTMKNEQ
jgi:hypothetical protein